MREDCAQVTFRMNRPTEGIMWLRIGWPPWNWLRNRNLCYSRVGRIEYARLGWGSDMCIDHSQQTTLGRRTGLLEKVGNSYCPQISVPIRHTKTEWLMEEKVSICDSWATIVEITRREQCSHCNWLLLKAEFETPKRENHNLTKKKNIQIQKRSNKIPFSVTKEPSVSRENIPIPARCRNENHESFGTASPKKCLWTQAAIDPNVSRTYRETHSKLCVGIERAPFTGPAGPNPRTGNSIRWATVDNCLSIWDKMREMSTSHKIGCCSNTSPAVGWVRYRLGVTQQTYRRRQWLIGCEVWSLR